MAAEIVDQYFEGATSPAYQRNFGDGTINITGWVFTLEIRRADGSFVSVAGAITDVAAGDYEFVFGASDLIKGKNQRAQIRVVKMTSATGTEIIGPIWFTVADDGAT